MNNGFDARMTKRRDSIDARLKKIIDAVDYPAPFKDVLDYAVFPGGKRLRPILFLEWHDLFSPPDARALDFACGFEIMHCYSLIHDDMPCMDNDDIRRGNQTVHKRFGEGTALLAGDALLNLAYETFIAACGERRYLLDVASRCGREIIHGQYTDLFGNIESLSELIDMYGKKTAALIAAACVAGSIFGNADVDCRIAEKFGNAFGTAFQIYDDVTEYLAGEKSDGTSVLEFLDLDGAKRLLNKYIGDAQTALDKLDCDTSKLRALTDVFVIN